MPGFFKRSAILTASTIAMAAIGTAVFSYFQSSHLYTEMPLMANVLAATFTALPTVFILATAIDAIRPERANEVENRERPRTRDDEGRDAERNRLRALERAARQLRQEAGEQRDQIAALVAQGRLQQRQLPELEDPAPAIAPARNRQQRQGAALAVINASSKNSPTRTD